MLRQAAIRGTCVTTAKLLNKLQGKLPTVTLFVEILLFRDFFQDFPIVLRLHLLGLRRTYFGGQTTGKSDKGGSRRTVRSASTSMLTRLISARIFLPFNLSPAVQMYVSYIRIHLFILAPSWLDSSVGRALHRHRRSHWFNSRSQLLKLRK